MPKEFFWYKMTFLAIGVICGVVLAFQIITIGWTWSCYVLAFVICFNLYQLVKQIRWEREMHRRFAHLYAELDTR